MNRLLKLSEAHYIVVDDCKIEVNYWCVLLDSVGNIFSVPQQYTNPKNQNLNEGMKRITHSTQPLEIITALPDTGQGEVTELSYNKIKPLSLLEVEELIYGYNVQTMAKQQTIIDEFNSEKSYVNGFNAHKEIVKDKLLSIQLYSNNNHLEWIYNRMIEVHGENPNYDYMIAFKKIIQSLFPPTEWDVTFDEQGKLKLV
jgi:hypothetical protein